jgi:hypothetical protein
VQQQEQQQLQQQQVAGSPRVSVTPAGPARRSSKDFFADVTTARWAPLSAAAHARHDCLLLTQTIVKCALHMTPASRWVRCVSRHRSAWCAHRPWGRHDQRFLDPASAVAVVSRCMQGCATS